MVSVELPLTLYGNCALICWLETKSSGTGAPLMLRQESPKAVGRGIWLVAIFTRLICAPNTLIRPPGATGWVPLAALTTEVMLGAATAASYLAARTVKPDVVN